MLHALVLLPYYFVGPLAVLPLLLVVSRLLRLKVSINTLVGSAIGLSAAGIIVPLACGWLDLSAFTGRPLAVLIGMSLALAAVDAALSARLPLPLDTELQDL